MPEPPPEELIYAVKGQAEARLRMDVSAYARYLTPEAVDSLRASFPGLPPRVAAYEIDKHEPRGADHLCLLPRDACREGIWGCGGWWVRRPRVKHRFLRIVDTGKHPPSS